jgi:hypothetical protein
MRDWKEKLGFVVLSPIWLSATVVCAVCFGLAIIISHVPLVGVLIAMPLLLIAAPFAGIFQCTQFCYMWLSRADITLSSEGFTLRHWRKTRSVYWQDVIRIQRLDGPPIRHYELHCANGEVIVLNPFTDAKEFISKLTSNGVRLDVSND